MANEDYQKRFEERCLLKDYKKQKEANCIAVGGMISAGKSTIVEAIVKRYKFQPVYELSNDPEDLMNILLDKMYQREVIAESVCQLQFLLDRHKKYKESLTNNPEVTKVYDRTIFEDRLFAFHNLLSQPTVYEYYEKLWRDQVNELIYNVGTPKMYFILSITWEKFLERLYKRNRAIEIKNFKKNETYFRLLNSGYIQYLTNICSAYRIPYTIIDVTDKEVEQTMEVVDKVLREIGLVK